MLQIILFTSTLYHILIYRANILVHFLNIFYSDSIERVAWKGA